MAWPARSPCPCEDRKPHCVACATRLDLVCERTAIGHRKVDLKWLHDWWGAVVQKALPDTFRGRSTPGRFLTRPTLPSAGVGAPNKFRDIDRTRSAVEGLSKEKTAQLTQSKVASRSATTPSRVVRCFLSELVRDKLCLRPRPRVQSVLGRRSLEPLPAVRMASSWRFVARLGPDAPDRLAARGIGGISSIKGYLGHVASTMSSAFM